MAGFSQAFSHEYGQQTIKVQESNRNCDNDVDQVMNALTQIQEEYKSSVLKMQGTLEKLITPDDLSGNAKRVLCETVACLQALNINDATITNVILQSTKMVMEESCLSRKKLQFKSKLPHQSPEKQRLTKLERNFQSAKKEGEEFRQAMKGKAVETQFLELKIEEYKNRLEKLKVEAQRLGISVNHKVIQERVEAIAQMKHECATLRLKLEKYEGLPPNLQQAQEMLAQVKQKNVYVDQQVQTQLIKHKELTASLMSVPRPQVSWNFRRPKDEPGNK